ncbi:MAG: hypothetical protein AAB526_03330, partial [Patescibacteria group bacterium]
MNINKNNNKGDFNFLIFRGTIILILFFAIFFQKEIIQKIKNTEINSLYFSIEAKKPEIKTEEPKIIKPEIKTEEPKIIKPEIKT